MSDDEKLAKALTHLYEMGAGGEYMGEFAMEELGYDYNDCTEIPDRLKAEGLGDWPGRLGDKMVISDKGRKVEKAGGYLVYLQKLAESETLKRQREAIEFELAQSNIEANKLNQKNANRNMVATIVNIIIGLLNLAVLAMQLL